MTTDTDHVRFVVELPDGTYIVEHADGRLERKTDETDWERVTAMTEEEIEAAACADPDFAEFKNFDWSKAELVMPAPKRAISIRLDADVVDFFKRQGPGYQTRINAVLRSFMKPGRARTRG